MEQLAEKEKQERLEKARGKQMRVKKIEEKKPRNRE